MDDDKLLRSLGAAAARQDRDPDRAKWERVTRGEASAEELAELERLAADDEEALVLLSAHRPIDAAARARITDELATKLARRPGKGRLLRLSFASGGLAVAAAVAIAITRPPSLEPLPSYDVEVSGAATTRGPGPAAPSSEQCILHANGASSFELFVRPAAAVSGRVEARGYLVEASGARAWPGAIEISPKGALHVVDQTDALGSASELRIVVGRPAEVTAAAALAKAQGSASAGRGWLMVRCAIAR